MTTATPNYPLGGAGACRGAGAATLTRTGEFKSADRGPESQTTGFDQ